MSDITRERIKKRMEELGTNPSRTSLEAGLNFTYLRDYLTGRAKNVSVPKLEAIAKALETTPQYLMGESFTAARPVQAQTMPILGRAAASIIGSENIIEDPIEYSAVPPGLVGVRDAYCLWVEGTSMRPLYKPRDPIFVHPRQPVSQGDIVVIQEQIDGGIYASVKEFVRLDAEKVHALQYNPASEMEFSRRRVVHLHRVLPMREVLGL